MVTGDDVDDYIRESCDEMISIYADGQPPEFFDLDNGEIFKFKWSGRLSDEVRDVIENMVGEEISGRTVSDYYIKDGMKSFAVSFE